MCLVFVRQQEVKLAEAADDNLIGRREAIVAFLLESRFEVGKRFGRSEEFHSALYPAGTDAGNDHGYFPRRTATFGRRNGDQAIRGSGRGVLAKYGKDAALV